MYCNKCGKELEQNQKFCTNCGNQNSSSQDFAVGQFNDNRYNDNIRNSLSEKEIRKITDGTIASFYIIMMLVFDILGIFLVSMIVTTIGLSMVDSGNTDSIETIANISAIVGYIYYLSIPLIIALLIMPSRIRKLKDKIPYNQLPIARKKLVTLLIIVGVIHCIINIGSIIGFTLCALGYYISCVIILKKFDARQ